MNKHIVATITALTLVLSAGAALASLPSTADLSIDPGRLSLTFYSPTDSELDLAIPSNSPNSALQLPCDLEGLGGGIDTVYAGPSGHVVYPVIDFSFFTQSGQAISSRGCNNTAQASFTSIRMDVEAVSPGTRQTDGFMVIDEDGDFCAGQYTSSDLPANQPMRLHMVVTGYTSAAHTTAVPDPNPLNNARDIWVERVCNAF